MMGCLLAKTFLHNVTLVKITDERSLTKDFLKCHTLLEIRFQKGDFTTMP